MQVSDISCRDMARAEAERKATTRSKRKSFRTEGATAASIPSGVEAACRAPERLRL